MKNFCSKLHSSYIVCSTKISNAFKNLSSKNTHFFPEHSFSTQLTSDDEENSDVDVEDGSSDSGTNGPINSYITQENETNEHIRRTLLLSIDGSHNTEYDLSSTKDIYTPATIMKSGRKPRRRRTAFTHAQLAYLERKFR